MKNRKLKDAMDKKFSADKSWERTYESMQEKIDIERLYLAMDICNRSDAILLQEQALDRQRKLQRIHVDVDSADNTHLEQERLTILSFIRKPD